MGISVDNPIEEPNPGGLARRNVFTIPPGVPFLPTLAESIINGVFGDGPGINDEPMALVGSVIYVPTRRSARSLGMELLEAAKKATGVSSIILPRIRTIGDLDEEEIFEGLDSGALADLVGSGDTKSVIDPVERHLQLAILVQAWANNLSEHMRSMLGGEAIAIPSSSADALYLAKDLANFIDQVETETIDWTTLEALDDDSRLSAWWDLTLNFLQIIMKTWPDYLRERNLIDPATFRNQVIDLRIEKLKNSAPTGFVLAAGTTGSIPATTRLLLQIRKMKNGAIVLPGFDTRIPDETANRIQKSGELNQDGASSTYAQYGMIKLLDKLSVHHKHVDVLGDPAGDLAVRESIINNALLPAGDTKSWPDLREKTGAAELDSALAKVCLIEAMNEVEEAAAIALVLREALATPNKTAALVTPDRKLARRVSAELQRFNVQIDDTAGYALSTTMPANYLRLLLRCVFDPYDPVILSSFIKLELNLVGDASSAQRRQLELFELVMVRDRITIPDLGGLEQELKTRREAINATDHAPRILKALTDEEWEQLESVGRRISFGLRNLLELASSSEKITPDRMISDLVDAANKITSGESGDSYLFAYPGGSELTALLKGIRQNGSAHFQFDPTEAVSVFDALIAGARYRSTERTHPRLHIYGALEARLQHADLIVLGGLNEGTWPQVSGNDPYLNRPMRSDLGLPLPERRIGLAAHDFSQLSGAREVVYSRSRRVGDAPSVASRWLQRLMTFLGEDRQKALLQRGNRYIDLVHQIGRSAEDPLPIERPKPTPPVEKRPNRLSFTEIETWMRDPYSIYAKHILKLRSLPDISREAHPALKGTIYHSIVAEFINSWSGAISPDAYGRIEKIADAEFENHNLPDEIRAIWRPRFDPVASAFLDWEAGRRGEIHESFCETKLEGEIEDTGFYLHGSADRIDILNDGDLVLIDYKTGTYPSKKQARTLVPQLTLEGAMAARGHAKEFGPANVSELFYIRLLEGGRFATDALGEGKNHKGETLSAGEYAENAYGELIDLINAYRSPEMPYVSLNAPAPSKRFKGDYDHLARIAEWSVAEDDAEGAE